MKNYTLYFANPSTPPATVQAQNVAVINPTTIAVRNSADAANIAVIGFGGPIRRVIQDTGHVLYTTDKPQEEYHDQARR